MTTTTRMIVANLATIDGKDFKSKEDIENAVFPLFGPLQSLFPGEGHRDLVDKLIAAKWITLKGDDWHVALPDVPDEPKQEPKFDKTSEIDPHDFKAQAIAAILADDYKRAIRILTSLI